MHANAATDKLQTPEKNTEHDSMRILGGNKPEAM
jgi:hypothetical protein